MEDNFEEFTAQAPKLVFETEPEKPQPQQQAPQPQQEEALNDSMLSQEERMQVDAFVQQIDLRNSNAVLNYGTGTQKRMADFSEKALQNVRTKDMGEIGNMVAGLVTQLRSLDSGEESRGMFGFFKKGENKVAAMRARYSKVETNVNEIVKSLENHQALLLKDISVLDHMYEINLNYFKELSMYILAGKKKLQQVRSQELAELQRKAAQSGLPEDAQDRKSVV